MPARMRKVMNVKCAEKRILPVLVLCGLIPYLQAGDIEHINYLTDIYPVIDAKMASDLVE